MEANELEILVSNEKEWRVYIVKKVDRIEQEMVKLKLKVMATASIFGALAGITPVIIKGLLK